MLHKMHTCSGNGNDGPLVVLQRNILSYNFSFASRPRRVNLVGLSWHSMP